MKIILRNAVKIKDNYIKYIKRFVQFDISLALTNVKRTVKDILEMLFM